jgi:hypothetical protein
MTDIPSSGSLVVSGYSPTSEDYPPAPGDLSPADYGLADCDLNVHPHELQSVNIGNSR